MNTVVVLRHLDAIINVGIRDEYSRRAHLVAGCLGQRFRVAEMRHVVVDICLADAEIEVGRLPRQREVRHHLVRPPQIRK